MQKKDAEAGRVNEEIARIFYEIADILEIKKVKWKPQAYRMAAQTLESSKDVKEIYKKKGIKGIDKLPGIGEGLSKKIVQYIETGKIQEYEKQKKSIPSGLYEMMSVPGIGAKRALLFYEKLKIRNIKQLKKAAEKGEIKGLPLFKERAEEKILEGIQILKGQKGRIPLRQAKREAKEVLKELRKLKEVKKVEAAGSLRRKKPTIRDIDIVVETEKPRQVIEKFVKMSFVEKVLGKGHEKATIITKQRIQVDVRVFGKENFGSGLLYFTGDKQHNIWLRKIAIKKGWKLNEYGLFEAKTGKRIAGKSEKEIYDKLGVKMVKPEKRVGETK
jgi:DNA polymerase (family 10)